MITNEVINQAIDYIMQHINEEIAIEDVAEYCHFSKFYFSRMFKEETGESLYAFIKRVRMDQSAFRLKVERNKTITDIGLEYGYTPSNYSSVFKQHHNASPADFRRTITEESIRHPFFQTGEHQLESLEECKKKITVENFPDMHAIYERRVGSYRNLGQDWCEFLQRYEKYQTETSLIIERTYDDPSITDTDNCMYDLCLSVSEDCPLENVTVIQGGRFAVYHFDGSVWDLYAAYQSFFTVWFPQSQYEIDDRYGFDIYRDMNCETGHAILDICFPIK